MSMMSRGPVVMGESCQRAKRAGVWLVAVLSILAAGCEDSDRPMISSSSRVAISDPDLGVLWPVFLQHCRRAPDCDPMREFSAGVGEASGIRREVSYFVRRGDGVSGGAAASAGRSFMGLRSSGPMGGRLGRPVTSDEAPSNLRASDARSSRLWLEYAPADLITEPVSLRFVSPHLALGVPGAGKARSVGDLEDLTERHLLSQRWPDGGLGARIELLDQGSTLWAGYSTGKSAVSIRYGDDALKRGFVPWSFSVETWARGDELSLLAAAFEDERTLGVRISLPGQHVILRDAFYSVGYVDAYIRAADALSDPAIDIPIPDRCRDLVAGSQALRLEASPAQETCLFGDGR